MLNQNSVNRKIQTQLAHVMACYGDNPTELMYKLEQLVLEWLAKGIEQTGHAKVIAWSEHLNKVNRYTKASKNGKTIFCPKCDLGRHVVFHFSWSTLQCTRCLSDIPKYEWHYVKKN